MDDEPPLNLSRLYDAETERPQDVGPPIDPDPPSLNLISLFKGLSRLFGGG